MGYQCEDFSLDLRKCTAPWNYIWVNSGFGVCAPAKGNVTGVKGFYAPPFAAENVELSFSLEAEGHSIEDTGNKGKEDCGLLFAGGVWQPDKILRKGTYHYKTEKGLISLAVESQLVPLFQKAGFLVRIGIKNRGEQEIRVKVIPSLIPGNPRLVELSHWDFMPPKAGTDGGKQISANIWENDTVRQTLLTEGCEERIIEPGQTRVCRAALIFSRAGEAVEPMALSQCQKQTRNAWDRRMTMADEGVPRVKSNIPGLAEYYRRSLVSGLVCLWENDAYVCNPFPATSGMDGGSICCYP